MGFPTNIEMCRYVLDSVFAQGYTEYKEGYKRDRSITFAESFWHGFSDKLVERFKENSQQAEELVVYDPVRNYFNEITMGRSIMMSFSSSNKAGVEAGNSAADKVQIRSGVGASQKGNLLE